MSNIDVKAIVPSIQFVDDSDPSFSTTGTWAKSTSTKGYRGVTYHTSPTAVFNVATWTFNVTPGTYNVATTWSALANRASNAPFSIYDGNVLLETVLVNQKNIPNDFTDSNTNWFNLGTFSITGSVLVAKLSNNADNYVIADAVRVEDAVTLQINLTIL